MFKLIITICFFLSFIFLFGCQADNTNTLDFSTTSQLTTASVSSTEEEVTTTETIIPEELSLIDSNNWTIKNNDPSSNHVSYRQDFNQNNWIITPSKHHKLDSLTKDISMLDLSDYKKLVITVKGDGYMIMKLNSTIFIEPGKDSIYVPLSMFETTFEFNLDFTNYQSVRDTLQSITLTFGADANEISSDLLESPPKYAFTSEIIVTKLAFSKEEADPNKTFNKKGVVTNPEDLADLEDISLMDGWMINEEGSYFLSSNEGNLIISSTQDKGEWSYIYLELEGNLKNYTVITITAYGTAGTAFKMKLEGPGITVVETGSNINGNIADPILSTTPQTFNWILSPDNLTAGETIRLLIFFEPGQVGSGASMTITEFYLKTFLED